MWASNRTKAKPGWLEWKLFLKLKHWKQGSEAFWIPLDVGSQPSVVAVTGNS